MTSRIGLVRMTTVNSRVLNFVLVESEKRSEFGFGPKYSRMTTKMVNKSQSFCSTRKVSSTIKVPFAIAQQYLH